jgi:molybdopterin molybdotransferase
MDGYAVRCKDVKSGGDFQVSQRIAAGDVATPLEQKTVARIFTGAMIPDGADGVILQEDTLLNEDDSVRFVDLPTLAQHIRKAGQDIAKDALIMRRGERLTPAKIGLLASVGIARVDCYKRARVAFFSTGDELADPGEPLGLGKIYNSNRYFLESCLRDTGAEPVDLGRCPDSASATRELLLKACDSADFITTTGGMSVGEEDYVREQLNLLGDIAFWKVAMKPGKPFAYGRISDTPFFGLPGNPVSAFVGFHLLVRPALLRAMGALNYHPKKLKVVAGFDCVNRGQRVDFQRCMAQFNSQGVVVVSQFNNQSSGVLSSISASNVLVPVAPGMALTKGDFCEAIVLSAIA